jgi:hypothetical protein
MNEKEQKKLIKELKRRNRTLRKHIREAVFEKKENSKRIKELKGFQPIHVQKPVEEKPVEAVEVKTDGISV